ncbi:DUF5131 family protein [Desulfobulbus elongatus]|uniref:DUF5131 family protein n=1 Tax=Desulfobulbus elongatus TaxID=53332 RepID=UPI000A046171|nr:DUF5131 family protein [Desulfobulbus elongatus]
MGKQTGISWTDHTWNPWQGCRPVSPGCANCYMYREKRRYGQDPATVMRSSRETFNAPLKWMDPAKVFVCSWSDFFIDNADQWRDEAWKIMRKTPHLTFQILTKRPENIAGRLPDGWPFPNVWIGITAENQEMANKRIPILLKIPAELRFVSIEPMVGPVDLTDIVSGEEGDEHHFNALFCDVDIEDDVDFGGRTVGWVIVGGETGQKARTMQPEWALAVKEQCCIFGTPFFMKQMSGKKPIPEYLLKREFPGLIAE